MPAKVIQDLQSVVIPTKGIASLLRFLSNPVLAKMSNERPENKVSRYKNSCMAYHHQKMIKIQPSKLIQNQTGTNLMESFFASCFFYDGLY
jgi:hypothetical protein